MTSLILLGKVSFGGGGGVSRASKHSSTVHIAGRVKVAEVC